MDVDLERRRISLSMRAAAETLGIEIEIAGAELLEEEAEEADAEIAEVVDDHRRRGRRRGRRSPSEVAESRPR